MELNLEKQKQRFLDVCQSTIHRDGLESLLDWLCKVDFFQAPASTRYHGAYAGGLCKHSLNVYEYAKKLAFMSPVSIPDESLAIAFLFHDVCKCNLYKTEYRNQKIKGGSGNKSLFLSPMNVSILVGMDLSQSIKYSTS